MRITHAFYSLLKKAAHARIINIFIWFCTAPSRKLECLLHFQRKFAMLSRCLDLEFSQVKYRFCFLSFSFQMIEKIFLLGVLLFLIIACILVLQKNLSSREQKQKFTNIDLTKFQIQTTRKHRKSSFGSAIGTPVF